jgi:hypothetical protein
METNTVGLRAVVGRGLGLLGVLCAVVGLFIINGISIELPGIMLRRRVDCTLVPSGRQTTC